MELKRSAEDYLEAILILRQQKGVVRSVDVAHHLDYTKPSVSRAVNSLRADGYLNIGEDGALVLTQKGQTAAETVYERHVIITQLLTSIGVSGEVAAKDACRVEHAISAETFERLKAAHAGRQLAAAPATPGGGGEQDKKKKKKKKGR